VDLSYNAEYEAFRQTVISFLKAHWPVPESAGEGAADWPRPKKEAWFRKRAIDAGFLYRGVPKEFGGAEQEADILKATIIRDEFSKRRAPMEAPGIGNMMLVPTLLECGATVALPSKEHGIVMLPEAAPETKRRAVEMLARHRELMAAKKA